MLFSNLVECGCEIVVMVVVGVVGMEEDDRSLCHV